jgi:hypothetical protein
MRMDEYIARSTLLADPKNESGERNANYTNNFKNLEKLVLVIFAKNILTIESNESAWFFPEAATSKFKLLYAMEGAQRLIVREDSVTLTPIREQPLYKENWISRRVLDEAGKALFTSCDGRNKHISDDCWKQLAKKCIGAVRVRGHRFIYNCDFTLTLKILCIDHEPYGQ